MPFQGIDRIPRGASLFRRPTRPIRSDYLIHAINPNCFDFVKYEAWLLSLNSLESGRFHARSNETIDPENGGTVIDPKSGGLGPVP